MVAAAPSQGRFRAGLALLSFLSFVVVVVSTLQMPQREAAYLAGLEKAPSVLVDRAQQHLAAFTATEPPRDWAWGFTLAPKLSNYLFSEESGWRPYDRRVGAGERSPSTYFWYRESAHEHLAPVRAANFALGVGRTMLSDPPAVAPGTNELLMDPGGGLVVFRARPTVARALTAPHRFDAEPDWAPFFAAVRLVEPVETAEPAGELDEEGILASPAGSTLRPVRPAELVPGPTPPLAPLLVPHDVRRAWIVPHPAEPGRLVRVEAAAWRGEPVFFAALEELGPDGPGAEASRFPIISAELLRELYTLLFLLTVCIAIPVAWRNHRMGRSDRRGAALLAMVWFGLRTGRWVLQGTHVPEPHRELEMIVSVIGAALFETLLFWVIYSALEPLVRRFLPHSLISWNRLLGGRVRDARVGLDLSVGAAVGATWALFAAFSGAGPERLGGAASSAFLDPFVVEPLRGPRHILATALGLPLDGIAAALQLMLQLALLRAVLQSTRAAAVALVGIYGSLEILSNPEPLQVLLTQTAAQTLIAVVLLVRFGLTMVCAAYFIYYLLLAYPVTWDLTHWYSDASLFAIVIAIGFSLFALQTARAALRSEMEGHR